MSFSVPRELPEMVLDKLPSDPLEDREWSGQFIAAIDKSPVQQTAWRWSIWEVWSLAKRKQPFRICGILGSYTMWLGQHWNVILVDLIRLSMHNWDSFIHIPSLKLLTQQTSRKTQNLCLYVWIRSLSKVIGLILHQSQFWIVESESCRMSSKTYMQRYDNSYQNMTVFSAWSKNIIQLQDSIWLDFGSAGDEARSNFTGDNLINKTFSGSSDPRSPTQSQCHKNNTKSGSVRG